MKKNIITALLLVGMIFFSGCKISEVNNIQENNEITNAIKKTTTTIHKNSIEDKNSNANPYTYTKVKREISYKNPQVLNIVQGTDIQTLDNSLETDIVSTTVMGNILEGLFYLDENHNPTPALVESYTISDDRLVYHFKLRESFWSNGEMVTADDFVYSFRRLANPKVNSQYQFMIKTAQIKNYESVILGESSIDTLGITAINPQELEIKLETPVPYFFELMAFPSFYPINKAFCEKYGSNFGKSISTMLFNGPYILASWNKNKAFVLFKNANYWDKENVSIDKINVKVVKDNYTSMLMYKKDEIDMCEVKGEVHKDYLDSSELKASKLPNMYYLQLNTKNEIFNNINARKAIALAFDKKYITNEILKDESIPANYLVPTGFFENFNNEDFRAGMSDYNTKNTDKALEYWKKAKEELGFDSYKIEILIYDNEKSMLIGHHIKDELQQYLKGIKIEVNPQGAYNKFKLEREGDFDISWSGWNPDYPDPMTFLDLWVTDGEYNMGDYSNGDYDELIDSCKSGDYAEIGRESERWTQLQKAEALLMDDVPLIPLYQGTYRELVKPYVQNLVMQPFGPDYFFKYVYLDGKE